MVVFCVQYPTVVSKKRELYIPVVFRKRNLALYPVSQDHLLYPADLYPIFERNEVYPPVAVPRIVDIGIVFRIQDTRLV
jgi:hypothetical protein